MERKQILDYKAWCQANAIVPVLKAVASALLNISARKVQISLDFLRFQPRTDGDTIWVSLLPDMLDPAWKRYWGPLHTAVLAHECQHINSSDFRQLRLIRSWAGSLFEHDGYSGSVGGLLAGQLLNAVEDGRIEQIVIRHRPGLLKPFLLLNWMIRNGTAIKERAEQKDQELQHLLGAILSYAKTREDPPGLEVYDGTELASYCRLARPLVDAGVAARDAAGCCSAVKQLITTLKPYLYSCLDASPDLQARLEAQDDPQPEYTSSCEKEFNDPGPQTEAQKKLRAARPDGDGEPRNSGASEAAGGPAEQPDGEETARKAGPGSPEDSPLPGGSGEQTGQPDGNPRQEPGTPDCGPDGPLPLSQEDLEELARQFEDSVRRAKLSAPREDPDSLSDADRDELLTRVYGNSENLEIVRPALPTLFLQGGLLTEALCLRRALQQYLQEQQAPRPHRRSGLLDQNSLWRYGMGDKDLFLRRNRPRESVVFYLLIDNSGSMAEPCAENMTKVHAARSAAAILEEALKGQVPIKIALFHQPWRNQHIVLKGFDETPRGNRCIASIQAILPVGCNADAAHIRVAAEELRRRRERKKILLVLSDGLPSAYVAEQSPPKEVKASVEDARKNGIRVLSILYGSQQDRAAFAKQYQEMYARDILSVEPGRVTTDLPLAIRHLLL